MPTGGACSGRRGANEHTGSVSGTRHPRVPAFVESGEAMNDSDWSDRLRGIARLRPGAPTTPTPPDSAPSANPFRSGGLPAGPTHPRPPAPAGGQPGSAFNPFASRPPTAASGEALVNAEVGWGAAAPPATAMPHTVRAAFLCLMGAAALALTLAAVGIYWLTELRDSVDKVTHLDPTGTVTFYAADYVDDAEITLISAAVGLGLVSALGYVLVGLAIRKGRRWPRPVGTALAVCSLPGLFLGPLALTAVLAGVVAMLLVWTPQARQFSARSAALKRAGSY